MATTNLNTITVGALEIQSGLGTPNHTSNSGTTYTDLSSGLRYISNGGTNWTSDKGFDTGTLTLSLDGGGVVLTTGVKWEHNC
jgi:hypothetical protein